MAKRQIIADHMVVDQALAHALVGRILAAGLPDLPGQPWHAIGPADLPDGTRRGLFVRHAADAVLTDQARNVVLITRRHPPGAGRPAIPGGFLDEMEHGCEDAAQAARRELAEETGIEAGLIEGATLAGIGRRRYDRPFDLRCAWDDFAGTAVKQGDIFMVSTQPVYFCTTAPLTSVKLNAGDDATDAHVMRIVDVDANTLGIPDQYAMLQEAP